MFFFWRNSRSDQQGKLKTKEMGYLITFLCLAILIVFYLLASSDKSDRNNDQNAEHIHNEKLLEIGVIDGAGNNRAIQHLVRMLRMLDYDVVEMRKSEMGLIEKSYVIDHSGKAEEVMQLAKNLGIPEDKVFQRIDKKLLLDATVVVGEDYLNLRLFKSYRR